MTIEGLSFSFFLFLLYLFIYLFFDSSWLPRTLLWKIQGPFMKNTGHQWSWIVKRKKKWPWMVTARGTNEQWWICKKNLTDSFAGLLQVGPGPHKKRAMLDELSTWMERVMQPLLGLVIVITNVLLLYFYRQRSQGREITLIFLGNLTASDILLGVILLIR